MAGKRRRGERGPPSIGRVRRSQVVGAFGIGALVDFLKSAVIMGGLDQWGDPRRHGFEQIRQTRLEARLGRPLFAPPASPDRKRRSKNSGVQREQSVPAYVFPEWFLEVPDEEEAHADDETGARWRRLVPHTHVRDGRYRGNRVTPVRWVRACPDGHVDDIDWRAFVHQVPNGADAGCTGQLFLGESSTSGDLADIFVRCSCKAFRPFIEAMKRDVAPLGMCSGRAPWLGAARASDTCANAHAARLLVRSATNAFFADRKSEITIPDVDADPIRVAMEAVLDDFIDAEDAADVVRELKKTKHKPLADKFTAAALWGEVLRRRGAAAGASPAKGIKGEELDTLLAVEAHRREDDESYFSARAAEFAPDRKGPERFVSKVVLLDRLREVVVQTGLTRLEPPVRDLELSLDVNTAPLGRDVRWYPAIENLGEGIFIALDPDRIATWRASAPVQQRAARFERGRQGVIQRGRNVQPGLVDPAFVMMHSLSHLLLTQLSLECGYSSSSLRERIYVEPSSGRCGVLLYTGAPDADGTLGGLVKMGERVGSLLEEALDCAYLCSNDPLCARHMPDDQLVERFTHGAACHGCLLIGEPSCEWGNEYLDRALVVETVEGAGASFFEANGKR